MRYRSAGSSWTSPQFDQTPEAVLTEIRAITDTHPTWGYRRVTALLNRARRKAGDNRWRR